MKIQVIHDLIGLFGDRAPKHAKAYLDLKMLISQSLVNYKKDVANTKFPSKENTYNLDKGVLEKLKEAIANIKSISDFTLWRNSIESQNIGFVPTMGRYI